MLLEFNTSADTVTEFLVCVITIIYIRIFHLMYICMIMSGRFLPIISILVIQYFIYSVIAENVPKKWQ